MEFIDVFASCLTDCVTEFDLVVEGGRDDETGVEVLGEVGFSVISVRSVVESAVTGHCAE